MALADRLIARIRSNGPITFASFMEAALFDPEDGYYTTRAAIGFEDADYFTSGDLGPSFGRALARMAIDAHTALGRPAAWDLVEAGAGRGIVMRDLLAALERERPDAARGARPAIVEVSPRLRDLQAIALGGRELRWATAAHGLAPIHGLIFGNEVLDAFPVHVLVRTEDGVREVYVAAEGSRLVETLRAASRPDLRWRVPETLPMGGRWEVSLAAESWVAQIAAALTRGYLLLIDYADDEAGLLARLGEGTLRGFSRHRLMGDPLQRPGEIDITATVNVTAIRRAAEGAGLRLAGARTQREVLLALGAREAAARPSTPLEQLRAASRRSAVDTLLDPNGLGAFRVLLFAKDAPAAGFRAFGQERREVDRPRAWR
ncbi:MAG: SAM-dependent methyltransferase [Chloroflexota bacterium]|nr:SAM-dependent methyltransferase [Chloroflexota bacterium]